MTDAVSPPKFAFSEARTLMKHHCQIIYQWADSNKVTACPPEIREALLATVSRLYEIVEHLPAKQASVPTTQDPDTGSTVPLSS